MRRDSGVLILRKRMAFCVLVTGFLLVSGCSATAMTIGPDSGHRIVIGKDATLVSGYAAKELQHYLKRITGQEFAIVTDDEVADASAPMILVGSSKFTEELHLKVESDMPDAFIIKTVGNQLILMGDDKVGSPDSYKGKGRRIPFDYNGGDHKGTLNAVYSFLEKFAGVRWLWPGESGEVVPKVKSIRVADVDIREAPDFFTRQLPFCYGSTRSKQYPPVSTKVRSVEYPLWYLRSKLGRGMPGGWGHAWAAIITDKYFKEHPEYYAFIEGERRPPIVRDGRLYLHGNQVCTSNPAVVRIFVDSIRRSCKPDEQRIVSVCPNDGYGFCECDACRALDAPDSYTPEEIRFGKCNLSNRVFGFVNAIAKEVKKTHPNVLLAIYSYSVFRDPPTNIPKLEDNVLVVVTKHCSFYNDPAYKQEIRERLEKWSRVASKFACYEYLGGDGWQLPHPISRILAEDIRYLKSRGFLSYHGWTATNFSNKGLDYYLAARMLWDSSRNREDIVRDYCEKGFGRGAPKMREYFDFMEKTWTAKQVRNWAHSENVPIWTPDVIAEGYRILEEAEQLADTAEDSKRIEFIRTGHQLTEKMCRYFRGIMRLIDAGLPVYLRGYEPRPLRKPPSSVEITEWVKEAHDAQEDLFAFFKKYEDTCVLQANYLYYVAGKRFGWTKSLNAYYKTYVAESGNRMLLPVTWKFNLDPDKTGEKLGWSRPEFDDSTWPEIRTDAFWEKQGYGEEKYGTKDGYNGCAWYRLNEFTVPAKYAGGKCILRFGAVDESCRVYVNGKLAGEFMFDEEKNVDSWKEPLEFDITPHINFGKANSFAVLVIDDDGAGGLWKRVFLVFEGWQKAVLRDGFEAEKINWGPSVHGDCEYRIVDDKAFAGKKCLFVHVKGQLPDNYMEVNKGGVPVEPEKQYKISLHYQLADMGENEAYIRTRQRRQGVPKIRLIFSDAKGKKTTDTRGYVWMSGPWKENVPEWTVLQRVFTTPPRTRLVNISIKFESPGKFWIDEFRLEEF